MTVKSNSIPPASLSLAIGLVAGCLVAPAPAALLDISDISWTLGPDLPANRKAGAVGFVGGKVVYAGGSQDGTLFETTTTFGWTPGAASWENLTPLPQQNGYFDGMMMPDGWLYIAGGRLGGMGGSSQATVRRFGFENGNYVWQTFTQPLARTRTFHTVGAVGSTIYAIGGGRFQNGQPPELYQRQIKDADRWDTANPHLGGSVIPDIPGVARFGPVTAGVNGKLYVFGGTNLGGPGDPYDSDRLHDAYVFNPATNAWSSLPNLPFGFSNGHAEVFKDRYIIMVGGVAEIDEGNPLYPPTEPNYYNNMVIVYDTKALSYNIMPSVMPKGTGDLRTVIVGNTIYAIGGETKGQETPTPQFNSAWLRIGTINLGPGEWHIDSPGNWTADSSWSTTVPNGVGALANLLGNITQPRTVTIDAPVTAGFVNFNNVNRYTVAGTSTLTLQVASGDGFVALSQGNHSITAPINLASPMKFLGPGALTTGDIASNVTLTVQTNTTSARIDGTGTVIVSSGRTLAANRIRQNALNVSGTLSLNGTGTASLNRVGTLTLAGGANPTARLNLGNSQLLIDYSAVSPLATVRSQIVAGRAGGAWNGPGISSSVAAANNSVLAVGYAEAADLGLTSVGDLSVDGTAILLRTTLLGDANLSGGVDLDDFTRLAAGFGQTGRWSNGDFNYDLAVNLDDFTALAANFGRTLNDIPGFAARNSVPEPSGAVFALLGALCPLIRRDGRQRC